MRYRFSEIRLHHWPQWFPGRSGITQLLGYSEKADSPHAFWRGIMDVTGLVIFLAIGAVAGWLASTIMKGSGLGLVGNIVIGVVGAIIGGLLFGALGLSAGGLIGSIITATVGAIVLLFIAGLVKKA
jgi:uncharacterized membrane protein YeaQ/YmgE (transglycosylase-associated protein family)